MGVTLCLKIYLVVLFSAIIVRALDNQWIAEKKKAFQVAGCIARCEKNKACRRECFKLGNRKANATLLADKDPTFSGPANFNATLHCKDIDVIKINHNYGVWVIEESSPRDDSWKVAGRVQVSDKMTSSFKNLSAGTSYRYKAYRIMANGVVSEPEISPWFSTFEKDYLPEEVTSVQVTSQGLDDKNPSRVRADIVFQPASDRSCRYDVVSWNKDEGLTIAEFESLQDFRFSLHNLDYETNTTVLVSARSIGSSQSSNNVSLFFVTPSCLQMHRSLIFCAPDQVKGLRISGMYKNESNYELVVAWDRPTFIPDTYILQFQYLVYENEEPTLMTISGNATEALLIVRGSDLDNHQRVISIIAESSGGTSAQTWIYVNLEETLHSFSKKSTSSTMRNTTLKNGIMGISSVAAFTVAAGIAYAYHLRKHKNRTNDDKNGYKYCQNLNGGGKDLECSFYGMGKAAGMEFENKYPLLPKDEFEIRPVQLTIKDILGSGASGIVRIGRYQTDKNHAIDVAVKTLKDDPSAEDLKNFRQEISIMKSAGHHPNIVSMIGCCTLDLRRPLLVVEYCSRGDLQTYLRKLWQEMMSQELERRARYKVAIEDNAVKMIQTNEIENSMNVASWVVAHQVAIANKLYDVQDAEYILGPKEEEEVIVGDLLNFARQVASGMEFLSSNRILHRDLAARNVLVCADKTAKISDFGLSRDIYQENIYKKQGNGRLPLKWMAIEALTHQIYTTKSDVWSFGILLWEIVTLGCNPYPETPTNMVLQLLKSGYRMKKPENCGNELYDVMRSCWLSRPRCRPSFTQLRNQLDQLFLRATSGDERPNILREPTGSSVSTKLPDNHYSNIYSK